MRYITASLRNCNSSTLNYAITAGWNNGDVIYKRSEQQFSSMQELCVKKIYLFKSSLLLQPDY